MPLKSLNFNQRKREQEKLFENNIRFVNRLNGTNPTIKSVDIIKSANF